MATPYHPGDRRHDSHSYSPHSKAGTHSRTTRPQPRQSSPISLEVCQHAHVARCLTQALIACPQRDTGGYDSTCQECHVYRAESPAPQPPLLYEMPHALIINVAHDHQALKHFQKERSILEVPQREFSDDALMHTHLVALEQINQNRLSFPQVIDPDVGVNKDSHARARLRGAASAAESLPPSAASCRPVSMRTRSSTASRIKADRSLIPVSSSARESRSSSSVTVVLMLTSPLSITPQRSSVDSDFDAASRPPSSHNSKAGPRPRATRPLHHLTELRQATSTVISGTIPLNVSPSASSARSSS